MASIAGSMFLMALVTLIPWFENSFFKGFEHPLSVIRASLAGTALGIAALVGIPQIKYLIGWIFDFYEFYQKFGEFKKKYGDKEE